MPLIKAFNVDMYLPKASRIVEVLWLCPAIGWLKFNNNDSFSSDWVSCGGLFKNHLSDFAFGFAEKIICSSSIIAEFFWSYQGN